MSASLRCMGYFFFSGRRRHTMFDCDWSSDVCSSDLMVLAELGLKDVQAALAQRLGLRVLPQALVQGAKVVQRGGHFGVIPVQLGFTDRQGAFAQWLGRSEERRVGKGSRSPRPTERSN